MFLINDLNLGLSLFQGHTQENKIVVSKLIGRFTVKGCFSRWYELWLELSCSRYFQLFFFCVCHFTGNWYQFFFSFFPPSYLDRVQISYFLCFTLFFSKTTKKNKNNKRTGCISWQPLKNALITQTNYHNILS